MNRLEAIEQEFGFAKQTVRWRADLNKLMRSGVSRND